MQNEELREALKRYKVLDIVEPIDDIVRFLDTGLLPEGCRINEVNDCEAFTRTWKKRIASIDDMHNLDSLDMKSFIKYLEKSDPPPVTPIWSAFGDSPLAYQIYLDASSDRNFISIGRVKASDDKSKILYSYYVDGRWVREKPEEGIFDSLMDFFRK